MTSVQGCFGHVSLFLLSFLHFTFLSQFLKLFSDIAAGNNAENCLQRIKNLAQGHFFQLKVINDLLSRIYVTFQK